jgi:single-stranded-DNA-specific exonuclease
MIDPSPSTTLRGHRAQWTVHPPLPDDIRAGLNGSSVMLAHLLYHRGYRSLDAIHSFYTGAPVSHDPFLMPDMAVAVERIVRARENREQVAVHGDFDCDGITATAVLVETLTALGLDPTVHVPERVDGHGLQPESLAVLHDRGVSLVITADCGITAVDEVQVAHGLGLDVIITDHHEPRPDGTLPDCPVVAPTRLHSEYPFRGLCGAGVVYKLAQGLAARLPGMCDPSHSLDLVALGTVADIVPLQDENRSLVIAGLQKLKQTTRPGLRALFRTAGVDQQRIDPVTISFYLAPRINAANRMASPRYAYDLLTATNTHQADALAEQLSDLNRKRQAVVETTLAVLLADMGDPLHLAQAVASGARSPILLVEGTWPAGISGLLAAKLVDAYGLPAFVGTRDGELMVVSGRGVAGSRIDELLEWCDASQPGGLFVGYGGHSRAGGFRVQAERWPLVRDVVYEQARRLEITTLGATLEVDAEVSLRQLTLQAAQSVRSLAPFGMAFPEPLFLAQSVALTSNRLLPGKKHAKVRLTQNGASIGGVLFHASREFMELPLHTPLDVVFHLSLSEWGGTVGVEAQLRDWRLAH